MAEAAALGGTDGLMVGGSVGACGSILEETVREMIIKSGIHNVQMITMISGGEIEHELKEICRDFLPHIDRRKVVLMPQGVTYAEVQENARRVVESAKARGFRLMGRLQVDIWGAKRRV